MLELLAGKLLMKGVVGLLKSGQDLGAATGGALVSAGAAGTTAAMVMTGVPGGEASCGELLGCGEEDLLELLLELFC